MGGKFILGLFVTGALVMSGAATASASSGTEHFALTQTAVSGPETVVAIGPLTATGRASFLSNTKDLYSFKQGAIIVIHHVTKDSQHYNPKTCVYVEHQQGSYTVRGHSGAYAHARGSGTYRGLIIAHSCNPNTNPDTWSLVVEGTGQLSV